MVKISTFLGVVLGCILITHHAAGIDEPTSIYQSMEIEFIFPNIVVELLAILAGQSIAGNSLPIDMQPHYINTSTYRIFVTIPKLMPGIPVSLATISNIQGAYGPELYPYPDYSWHSNQDPSCPDNRIVSAFRVEIDECNRLWVLDSGNIDNTQVCRPKLLVFDLTINALIHSYVIPADKYNCNSLLVTLAVDVRNPLGSCSNTYVYMADVTGFGLIVYSMQEGRSWRVTNKEFFSNPAFGTITILGKSFEVMDGVSGLALSPRIRKSGTGVSTTYYDRVLLFHSLAGDAENFVNTTVLNDEVGWNQGTINPREFKVLGNRQTQASAQAVDSKGNLFFGMVNPPAIACWNIYKPYIISNIKIVLTNTVTLQFTSGLKIVINKNGFEELWIMTNKIQEYATRTLSNANVNFRIQAIKITNLLAEDIC